MNKKIIFTLISTLIVSQAWISPTPSDAQAPRLPRPVRQKDLMTLRIEEENQKIMFEAKYKGKAWFANKVGTFVGTLYGLEARFTAIAFASSSDFHKGIFKKEELRRKKIANWLCKSLTEDNEDERKRITDILELSSFLGHCNAFDNNKSKLSYTLATGEKLKITEQNKDSILLKFVKPEEKSL